MASDQKREEEIERLAREAGRLIREASPETQEELREAATAIMREEAHEIHETIPPAAERQHAMNPLAAGLGLAMLGAALAFIIPPVGLGVVVVGVLAIVWGVVISWARK